MIEEEVLTKQHFRELHRAVAVEWPARGVITSQFHGYGHRAWKRMMEKLVRWGYFTVYVHGGYEITAKGREILEGDRA